MEDGNLEIFKLDNAESLILKPLNESLKAGGYGSFPSAALDFPDDSIDFLKLLVKDPITTFPGRISGDSLKDIGVLDGDWCLIQKGIEAKPNDIVAAIIENQFFIKRFKPKYDENNQLQELKLKSENPDFSHFDINDETEFFLWGVVTWTFRNWRKL
ncbi:LexA repressor [Chryseobacterium sp. MOF25P]|uniref:LexA family protein n=1 Tax=unclassified Chryseobacterium TaxID=2593645 RepID=UPI000804DFF9|nr:MULTISPECIES: S24 family peptidase [unclassified Chryseobacterium]OBW43476.1 LexA repressor [Chryseobacterium sp. MOF25P]OBW46750.1 LexA repressor [Chryseobacterium sp. BGARF1]